MSAEQSQLRRRQGALRDVRTRAAASRTSAKLRMRSSQQELVTEPADAGCGGCGGCGAAVSTFPTPASPLALARSGEPLTVAVGDCCADAWEIGGAAAMVSMVSERARVTAGAGTAMGCVGSSEGAPLMFVEVPGARRTATSRSVENEQAVRGEQALRRGAGGGAACLICEARLWASGAERRRQRRRGEGDEAAGCGDGRGRWQPLRAVYMNGAEAKACPIQQALRRRRLGGLSLRRPGVPRAAPVHLM